MSGGGGGAVSLGPICAVRLLDRVYQSRGQGLLQYDTIQLLVP